MSCRCGHDKDLHTHYRRGSDCAICPCPKFRRQWLRSSPRRVEWEQAVEKQRGGKAMGASS